MKIRGIEIVTIGYGVSFERKEIIANALFNAQRSFQLTGTYQVVFDKLKDMGKTKFIVEKGGKGHRFE